MNKRRVSTFFSAKVFNRLVKAAARPGFPTPSVVILETTGRQSGRAAAGAGDRLLEGDTLWIVTEHGRKAAYVRNIEANPRVRVRVGRRWRPGTAQVLPERRLARASAAHAEQAQLGDGPADGDGASHGAGGPGSTAAVRTAFGRTEPSWPSACVNSLGMIQTLFDSPWAICGSTWRYW